MRHVKVENGYGYWKTGARGSKCSDCPVRKHNGLCPIRAEVVSPNRPVCRYGHRKIASANTAPTF